MKTQIKRLSPHQNGKVIGVLMALSSMIFVIPMMLIFAFAPTPVGPDGQPTAMPMYISLLFPILYLVMGYLMTIIGCALYNFTFKYIGGIEYETIAPDAPNTLL